MPKTLRSLLLSIAGFGVLFLIADFTVLDKQFPLTRMAILMKQGNIELREGNYTDAADHFLLAINLNPKRWDAYIYLADAYVQQSDNEDAVYYLQQGLKRKEVRQLRSKLNKILLDMDAANPSPNPEESPEPPAATPEWAAPETASDTTTDGV